MRECISLHIGQAGCQIGSTCWELYSLEHRMNADGYLVDKTETDHHHHHGDHIHHHENTVLENNLSTLYSKSSEGKYVPRAMFIDFEPTVVDSIRTGKFKNHFNPNFMITGKEDSADNFARGYYSEGKKYVDKVSNQLRRMTEACDSLQGFLSFRSFGGGTGSGFTSRIIEELILPNYGKKIKIEFAIYPSPTVSTSIVEPYNSILTRQNTDICFMMDNEAIFDICQKSIGIEWPSYNNLNRLISQVVSSVTSSLRFKGDLNVDLTEFQTNLVPYPRIHFPLINMSPLMSKENAAHCSNTTPEIINELFEESSQMIKCGQKAGAFMACCLLFRGKFEPNQITKTINSIKQRQDVRFVDWIPTGFKVGQNSSQPQVFPNDEMAPITRCCTMLSNTTSVKDAWVRLHEKFENMYKHRAFIHWYVGEGMEECEFDEAQESVRELIAEYEGLECDDEEEAY